MKFGKDKTMLRFKLVPTVDGGTVLKMVDNLENNPPKTIKAVIDTITEKRNVTLYRESK